MAYKDMTEKISTKAVPGLSICPFSNLDLPQEEEQFLRTLAIQRGRILFPPVDRPIGVNLDHYSAMSALQKAVRLGDYRIALDASLRLLRTGHADANWRRLRVIAVEDIGVGDPEVAAFILWLARSTAFRTEMGEETAAAVAVDSLCRAPKSRDMCDVASWAGLPGVVTGILEDFAGQQTSHLIDVAADGREPFEIRYAAARALYPAKPEGMLRWVRRSRGERLDLYTALKMPSALAYAIEADVRFGGDVLTSAGPVVWALLSASEWMRADRDYVDEVDVPLIRSVPASTFDRHTRIGQQVVRQLLREHEPLQDFFSRHPHADRLASALRALFYVEGGILRPRLHFEGSEQLYWSILEAKFASTGLPTLEGGGYELLRLMRDALPEINALRLAHLS